MTPRKRLNKAVAETDSPLIRHALNIPEIVACIALHIFNTTEHEEEWLRSMALVNRTWSLAVTPFLFRDIFLGPTVMSATLPDARVERLLQVMERRGISSHIRSLQIAFTKDPTSRRATSGFQGPSAEAAAKVLRQTSNLSRLVIDHVAPPDFIKRLLPPMLDLQKVTTFSVRCRAQPWRTGDATQVSMTAELAHLITLWLDLENLSLSEINSATSVRIIPQPNTFSILDTAKIQFKAMRSLVLTEFGLSDQELQSLFSACPLLESLHFARPIKHSDATASCTLDGMISALEKVAPSLKTLRIHGPTGFAAGLFTRVAFPKLEFISVAELLLDRATLIDNLPLSVVELQMFLLLASGSVRRASHFAPNLKKYLERKNAALRKLRVPCALVIVSIQKSKLAKLLDDSIQNAK